jgi:hypothetical protein
MITHVVLFQFKSEGKEENVARAEDMLLSMVGKVDSLRHLEVGLNIVESERAFDLALVTRFDDLPGLMAYAEHPVHVEVKKFLATVVERSFVVDYESA